METPWIEDRQLARALVRNEAFWDGQLEEYPLMWITVPDAKPGPTVAEPEKEEELWTHVDYIIESTEVKLSRTYYAGDALPVFSPWLGPDQFAGGAYIASFAMCAANQPSLESAWRLDDPKLRHAG